MKTFVDTYIKESEGSRLQATIYKENETNYSVTFSINGEDVLVENYPGKSIYYVEKAASNWIEGIKKLNG